MKIALLKGREDFERIFIASLEEFCEDYFGCRVNVGNAHSGGLTLRHNSRLNLIFPQSLPANDIANFTTEYRYAPSRLRSIAQKLYCWLAIRPPFDRFLSPQFLSVSDAPDAFGSWLLLPGNHSNRIIDFARNLSINFAKQGFDRQFLTADAQTRVEFGYLPAPRVLEIADNGLWYVEECIKGLPTNRIDDPACIDRVMEQVGDALGYLRQNTSVHIPAATYFTDLCGQVLAAASWIRASDALTQRRVERFVDQMRSMFDASEEDILEVCRTHGDLQPGNILVADPQFWLIDWEYSAVRSSSYDYLTYHYAARFQKNFGTRLGAMARKIAESGGIYAWGIEQAGRPQTLMPIFLLEDLETRLKEVASPAIFNKRDAILPWLEEASSGSRAITMVA